MPEIGRSGSKPMLDFLLTDAEVRRTILSSLLLAIGWYIGRRLTILWTSRQRENERSASAEREFLDLYGEFFALWKLWNYFTRDIGPDKLAGLSRAALLDRACQAEGRLESIIVRLASSRPLSTPDIEKLAQFRQLYQQIRATIRDNEALAWDSSEHPDYVRFKTLAPDVAAIIVGNHRVASSQMQKITANIYEKQAA